MWSPIDPFAMYHQQLMQQGDHAGIPMMPMLALPMQQPNNEHSSDDDDEDLRTLYCGNLDERVTDEILYEIFLQAGPIEAVRMPKDPSGKHRSYGFVTYVHQCAVPYAMAILQGLELFRKRVTIRVQATEKKSNTAQKRNSLPPSFNMNNLEDAFSIQQTLNNSFPAGNPFTNNYDYMKRNESNFVNDKFDRRARNSHRDSKPYDRHSDNNRRRSDGNTDRHLEREWDRNRSKQHYNSGNRRSEQRYSGSRR